jgi:hypothetical protein
MQPVRYLVALLVSSLLVAGLLCSQICDFNCSFYGCSLSSPLKASEESSEDTHCHQHKQAPEPQEKNSPSQCPGHFNAFALPSPPVTSAFSLHHAGYIEAPATGPYPSLNRVPVSVAMRADRAPDRSPPANSVLRI